MKIKTLLREVIYRGEIKNNHIVNALKTSSKDVLHNDVFFAIKGSNCDGNEYIDEAIKNGATTIISEKELVFQNNYINCIIVEEISSVLAYIAKVFYKDLTNKFMMIAVTGTNGKTTTTKMLYDYFKYRNNKTILIGTSGISFFDLDIETNNTTPDILIIYEALSYGFKNGYKTCIMEVSSIGIRENRCKYFNFDIILFTNLSHDHLDYHKNSTDYAFSKGLLLWNKYKKDSIIILNKDDLYYDFYLKYLQNKHISYGKNKASICLEKYYNAINYSHFDVNIFGKKYFVKTNLVGLFNIYNILSVISILTTLNYNIKDFILFLNSYKISNGRMEFIEHSGRNIFIDFAHTPDGFEKVLSFLSKHKRNKLFVVFGCGGERDAEKRPLMGKIASKYADRIYITSDNPRNENELKIIDEIVSGIDNSNYEIILDRKAAISEAIKDSSSNDIIAILGKGNEKYQIIKGVKYRFNDKDYVNELINSEK